MKRFTDYVSPAVRAAAHFSEPITLQFPPYSNANTYIGTPRHGVNIVVVEGRRGECTDWYLDTIVAKPYRECSEHEVRRFFDEVRAMYPLGRRIAPESLDARIAELAAKAQTHLL